MTIKLSQEVDQLFSAMSKLQGKIDNVSKDTAGYKNSYQYAELSQYINVSKELLEEHGLSVYQMPGKIEIVEVSEKEYKKDGTYILHDIRVPKHTVTTMIGHNSGQHMSESMDILIEKTKMISWGQSTGVAVSFGRRYAVAGTLKMAQEDDDNQLSKQDGDKSYSNSPSQKDVVYKKITQEKVDEIRSLLIDDQPRVDKILSWAQVKCLEDLLVPHYDKIIETLTNERTSNSIAANKDTNLITAEQASFITRLVTTERLNKILKDYNLNKLDEMSVKDYFKEYDILRQEKTISEDNSNIKKEA
ncbi:MAG: ERF family protein [Nanoarchaeota archaeon]